METPVFYSPQWSEADWCRRIAWFLEKQPEVGSLFEGQEKRSWDLSRADLLTEKLAIEVDRAHKWAEAVGQSMLYSIRFNRMPGIVLLSEDYDADQKFFSRCELVCQACKIHLWLVNVSTSELYVYGDTFELPQTEEEAEARVASVILPGFES